MDAEQRQEEKTLSGRKKDPLGERETAVPDPSSVSFADIFPRRGKNNGRGGKRSTQRKTVPPGLPPPGEAGTAQAVTDEGKCPARLGIADPDPSSVSFADIFLRRGKNNGRGGKRSTQRKTVPPGLPPPGEAGTAQAVTDEGKCPARLGIADPDPSSVSFADIFSRRGKNTGLDGREAA